LGCGSRGYQIVHEEDLTYSLGSWIPSEECPRDMERAFLRREVVGMSRYLSFSKDAGQQGELEAVGKFLG
jgi:hypothetical protein